MDYVSLSKEVSYALRHAPWEYELELDEEGFVPIDQLLQSINVAKAYERPVIAADLERVIETSDKKRHEIRDGMIRALYGHSVPDKLLRTAANPPDVLYHGTTRQAADAILQMGLKPMGRQYVHLSKDEDTARAVGLRRDSEPVLLVVDSASAGRDGIAFYEGNKKVWLADYVPCEYISLPH